MSNDQAFKALPITFTESEHKGEWWRMISREGTVGDLLKIFDIDSPLEDSEMAQVLRHLRRAMSLLNNED